MAKIITKVTTIPSSIMALSWCPRRGALFHSCKTPQIYCPGGLDNEFNLLLTGPCRSYDDSDRYSRSPFFNLVFQNQANTIAVCKQLYNSALQSSTPQP